MFGNGLYFVFYLLRIIGTPPYQENDAADGSNDKGSDERKLA